jgi:hypothetical protein
MRAVKAKRRRPYGDGLIQSLLMFVPRTIKLTIGGKEF